jgi:phosphoglucosamine mutase
MGKYFGTDGVRGRFGDMLTPSLARNIGLFLGDYPHGKTNRILIGQDPRYSSPLLSEAIKQALIERGATVIDLGYTTTPSLSYLLSSTKNFDFAFMISASHNPFEDNGIKIFNHKGEKLSEDVESLIEQFLDHPVPLKQRTKGTIVDGKDLIHQYIDFIAQQATFKSPKGKVLIDCANGSVSYLISLLIQKLGLNVELIHHQPNGKNINYLSGATYLDSLKDGLKKGKYLLGVSFDGDGDRMMAMLPNGFTIDGDAQIFIHALEMKKNNILVKNQVVLTIMSNLGLKKSLEQEGISIIEVPVGDRHVQLGLKNHQLILGGEQSGHVMFYDLLNTGSGLLSMVRLFNILFKDEGLTLSKTLSQLKLYPQVLRNVHVNNKETILHKQVLKDMIKMKQSALNGHGRILVRASGTESLIRVMVEAQTQEICENNVNQIVAVINQLEGQGE